MGLKYTHPSLAPFKRRLFCTFNPLFMIIRDPITPWTLHYASPQSTGHLKTLSRHLSSACHTLRKLTPFRPLPTFSTPPPNLVIFDNSVAIFTTTAPRVHFIQRVNMKAYFRMFCPALTMPDNSHLTSEPFEVSKQIIQRTRVDGAYGYCQHVLLQSFRANSVAVRE